MTFSMNSSQLLSPAIPFIAQQVHEQSGHGDRMEIVHELRNMDFYSQRQPGYGHCWVPNLLATETKTESLIWHHSPGWSDSYLVAGCLHGTTYFMEWEVFCSSWNRESGYRFAFLAQNASAKTTIHGFIECLIHSHVFHTAFLCSGTIHCSQWSAVIVSCSWNSLVLSCSLPSKAGSLIEWWMTF